MALMLDIASITPLPAASTMPSADVELAADDATPRSSASPRLIALSIYWLMQRCRHTYAMPPFREAPDTLRGCLLLLG